jgi:ubiquinone/menaquinone biosynthesis C-methylase UbiE|tara:strand:- start:2242 stop:3135 length:894 start_codon:yes stop_codon:yes gene_type:complete
MGIIKTIYKSSRWCKVLILFILIIVCFVGYKTIDDKEGFINQRDKFVIKEGVAIYDSFYSKLYDALIFNKIKNEYEVGQIINTTHPTEKSLILDVGSGTGDHVGTFISKHLKSVGLDTSPAMVAVAREKYPNAEFTVGSALNVMVYPAHTFTHVTSLNFTLYYMKNKYAFFRNCYEWLKPGGYLVIHLVNRDKFNPTLKTADPFDLARIAQSTTSLIRFDDFRFKSQFKLVGDVGSLEETITDNENKVRKHIHTLYMPTIRTILDQAKEAGFIVEGKVDLTAVQYDNEYLYILYKPE